MKANQSSCPVDEVAADRNRQGSFRDLAESSSREVDAAYQYVPARTTAGLLRRGQGTQGHRVIGEPDHRRLGFGLKHHGGGPSACFIFPGAVPEARLLDVVVPTLDLHLPSEACLPRFGMLAGNNAHLNLTAVVRERALYQIDQRRHPLPPSTGNDLASANPDTWRYGDGELACWQAIVKTVLAEPDDVVQRLLTGS